MLVAIVELFVVSICCAHLLAVVAPGKKGWSPTLGARPRCLHCKKAILTPLLFHNFLNENTRSGKGAGCERFPMVSDMKPGCLAHRAEPRNL